MESNAWNMDAQPVLEQLAARYLAGRTDILIPVTIGSEELLLVLVSFGAGLVAAILPALAAYRTK